MPVPRVVMFTRYPTPGKTKTRLIPALGADRAAALHRRLTEHTLIAVRASGLPFELRTTGAAPAAFADWLGDVRAVDQGDGDLGERLARAGPPYPTLFIGADAPDLTGALLRQAAAALERADAVIGPANDGGYWLLGLARPVAGVFDAIDWSTERVFDQTMARLRMARIEPALLPRLADCDRPEDLARWPDLAPVTDVAIVIPTLDEATTLPRLARLLAALDPPPAEILVVDGGSGDGTAAIARELGLAVIEHHEQGRSRQINRGVDAVASPVVCVLHADTLPPDDMVAVIRRTLADPKVALGGFTPLLSGPDRVRWATSFHNWIKTWYAPLLLRPHLFLRGVRLLFGDHAMFFRRADFLAAGGCDPGMSVMEEADLCVKMARFGRVRLVNRVILTSDRRVAAWGEWKANWIYFTVGLRWAMGLHARLGERYPHIR